MKPHKRKISEYENSLYFYSFLNPLEITENECMFSYFRKKTYFYLLQKGFKYRKMYLFAKFPLSWNVAENVVVPNSTLPPGLLLGIYICLPPLTRYFCWHNQTAPTVFLIRTRDWWSQLQRTTAGCSSFKTGSIPLQGCIMPAKCSLQLQGWFKRAQVRCSAQ